MCSEEYERVYFAFKSVLCRSSKRLLSVLPAFRELALGWLLWWPLTSTAHLQHSPVQTKASNCKNLYRTFLVKSTKRIPFVNPWPESPIPCMENNSNYSEGMSNHINSIVGILQIWIFNSVTKMATFVVLMAARILL